MSADDLRGGDASQLLATAIARGKDVVAEMLLSQKPELLTTDLGDNRGYYFFCF